MFQINFLWEGGGEFQGQKSWKHDFEITGDPKFPPGGSTFWSGFEAPVGSHTLCLKHYMPDALYD